MSRSFSQKFWEDKHGKLVIWQRPNIILMIWFGSTILAMLLPYGFAQKSLYLIGLIAITSWAILEIFQGVNYFRRLLGLVILLSLIINRIT